MLALRLLNEMPYSAEDVVFDFSPVATMADGRVDMLVAVVPLENVRPILQLLQNSGITARHLLLSAEGIRRWMQKVKLPVRKEDVGCQAVLHVGKDHSECCLIKENKLIFSRLLMFSTDDLYRSGIEEFKKQVQMVWHSFRKEQPAFWPKRITVICGSEAAVKLTEVMPEVPAVVTQPQDSPVLQVLKKKGLKEFEEGYNPAAAAGFLLLNGKPRFDFLPQEIAALRRTRQQRQEFLAFVLMVLVTILLGAVALGMDHIPKQRRLDLLRAQRAKIQKAVKQAKLNSRAVNFINGQSLGRMKFAEVFVSLYRITPMAVTFQNIDIAEGGILTIQGYSDASQEVSTFQNNLVQSELFQEVTLQYSKKRKRFKSEFTDFKIRCRIKTGGDGKDEV